MSAWGSSACACGLAWVAAADGDRAGVCRLAVGKSQQAGKRAGFSPELVGETHLLVPLAGNGSVEGCEVVGSYPGLTASSTARCWESSAQHQGGWFVRRCKGLTASGDPERLVLACGVAWAGWSDAWQPCPALVLPALPGLLRHSSHRTLVLHPAGGAAPRSLLGGTRGGEGTPSGASSCLWHCCGSADGCPVLRLKTRCLPAFGDRPVISKEADRNVGFMTLFTGRDCKASSCFTDFTLTLFCHQSHWGLRGRLQLPPEALKWAAGPGFSLVSELGEGR